MTPQIIAPDWRRYAVSELVRIIARDEIEKAAGVVHSPEHAAVIDQVENRLNRRTEQIAGGPW